MKLEILKWMQATVEPIDVTKFFTQSKYPVWISHRLKMKERRRKNDSAQKKRNKENTMFMGLLLVVKMYISLSLCVFLFYLLWRFAIFTRIVAQSNQEYIETTKYRTSLLLLKSMCRRLMTGLLHFHQCSLPIVDFSCCLPMYFSCSQYSHCLLFFFLSKKTKRRERERNVARFRNHGSKTWLVQIRHRTDLYCI